MSEPFVNDGDAGPGEPDALELELNEMKNSLGKGDFRSVEDAPDDSFGREYDAETSRQIELGYTKFTQALQGGDIAGALDMVKEWSPIAYQQLLGHLHRSGSPENVQQANQALLQQLNNIARSQEARALDTATKGYLGQVDKLGDSFNLSPEEREQVFNEVNAEVTRDPRLRNELRRGNVKAINSKFKETVEIMRLGPGQPDSIHDVKGASKEERAANRDLWLDQALYKLKRGGKR